MNFEDDAILKSNKMIKGQQIRRKSRNIIFNVYGICSNIESTVHVRFSEIIQFGTVIIPTQIVFMWSLKSSKLLRYCPKMYVYISCLIGNTLRLKCIFTTFSKPLYIICSKCCNYHVKVVKIPFFLHEVGLWNLE